MEARRVVSYFIAYLLNGSSLFCFLGCSTASNAISSCYTIGQQATLISQLRRKREHVPTTKPEHVISRSRRQSVQ